MLHSEVRFSNGNHYPISYEYSTSTTRLAATGFVATDLYKFCVQLDTNAIYMLTAVTPTWVQIPTGVAVVSNSSSLANGKMWLGNAGGVAQEVTMSGDGTITNAGALAVTKLTIASAAAGDVLYYNGSAWVVLAKDAGKYLKSGASAVSWDTVSAGGLQSLGMVLYGGLYASTSVRIGWVQIPKACTISDVIISVATAPTGASLICDVHYHATALASATTIFTTGPGTNRPTITATNFTATSGAPDVTSLAAGGFLEFYIDQVGSTIAGTDLCIQVRMA